ncbi:MAG: hypothetical protein IKX23_04790 [Treponema sp.]|nr:hypothetical protein [Treponema sp.]
MKKTHTFFKKLMILVFITLFTGLSFSCYTPSPLYGTWADNDGDKIIFMDDGTFSATIIGTDETSTLYSGSWTVIDNVLVFNIQGDDAATRNTEWDIRGALLYIEWTANNVTKTLKLYHIAR